MREDMKKVIITPPRHYGYGRVKGREANKDLEDLPTKESMRKKHVVGWGGKEFSDFLTPLYRFLEANVGRPWDEIYSEICQHADSRSTIGKHLRDHVWVAITKNVQMGDDGKIYNMDYVYRPYELWNTALYIHPVTGNLEKYSKHKEKPSVRTKFSCLEDKLAYYTPVLKDRDPWNKGPAELRTLQFENGKLLALFWKEGSEDATSYIADERHAIHFIDYVRDIIESNMKTASSSRNACIKEMSSIIKARRERKISELIRKDEKFDETLRNDKKFRKLQEVA